MRTAGFLAGGGELGALCRASDWTAHPLGPPENWSPSLKIAIRIMLTSRQPIWVGWGRELYFFYNDPYKAIIGGKHPWALGRPTAEVWREIWPQIQPLLAQALGGIEGTYSEDQLLIMERNGYPEETYYTFSYSPIPDYDGSVGGIICANTDDTERMLGERQLALLRDLSAGMIDPRSWREACENTALALATDARDFPFALIYMADDDSGELALVAGSGIDRAHPAAPPRLAIDATAPWPVAAVRSGAEIEIVSGIEQRFAAPLPAGPWNVPPTEAALVHIPSGRAGVMIVGLNPFRLFDDRYRDFLGLVASQVGAGIANAEAYEYERRRAESLAELDRAKTVFFANLSHEFRTPLTLMLGPLEESRGDAENLPPAERERIELVHRNSLRLLKLVNALLDFSRIEAGRMTATYEPTDLGAFTAELASNFRSATERAGLALEIDCPLGAVPVHVDRDMWEKIVFNLLSNAFKFTFEGSIEVSVVHDAAAAELVVRDTGTGIPAHEVPRLFERFHRIEGARGRSFEGSGIGLALVKELVELHGGAIRVESEEGRGTTFFVTIPLGTAHLPREHVRTQASGAPSMKSAIFVEEAIRWLPNAADARLSIDDDVPRSAARRARILVADDNADMREYICRLLGTHHDCDTVADGEAALDSIRACRPDLLVTDMMMPRLDGFGLIRALRADPALRDLPIIAVSARAGEEARVEGLNAGADDYLVKPFSARELIARVDGVLALARVRREMEDALRAEAQTLEAKVIERTADLEAANRRLVAAADEREKVELALRQSQKMEAVGKLTGGIAHDFNNLLQVIAGNLQLLLNDVVGNERAEQRIRNAIAGVTRGSKLVSQLLAFGRRQPLVPKVVNLGRFVRGVDELLRRAIGDGIEIETCVPDGLWNVLVDPSQAENALLNLAINARDAMNGHGRLKIEAGNATLSGADAVHDAEVEPGEYVVLAVTDNGCGMAPETIEHAFEPFFTTKPEGHGTGLGLSMVYGFVRQSGGYIGVDSKPGRGTTIRIYLPRVRQAEDVVTDVDAGPVTGGTETILVVEDDETVRDTVCDLLADLGYAVLRAKDARSALTIVESGVAIDLLFTDVVMPGPMRSTELARRVREHLPSVAILFTSGYADSMIVHGDRVAPGIELLSKPYRRETLARKIRLVLRNQAQRNALAVASNTPSFPSLRPDAGDALAILLVEDDDHIRAATAGMLAMLGHSVSEAADGERALEALRAGHFDVLIADISLPGISGAELALRARELWPHLRIVFATGYDSVSANDAERTPADGVLLRKPYDVAALVAALEATSTSPPSPAPA